jgi:hypothetical protein
MSRDVTVRQDASELDSHCAICHDPFVVKMSGGQLVDVRDDQRPLPHRGANGHYAHASCVVADAIVGGDE